jgi:hypothetical protein
VTHVVIRWLLPAVVAVGLGVTALELSSCVAHERRARTSPAHGTDGAEVQVPNGAEVDDLDPAALPHLTH